MKKKNFGTQSIWLCTMIFLAGIMLVFTLSGCDLIFGDPDDPDNPGVTGNEIDNAWLAANNWTIGKPFQTSSYTVSSVLTVPEERTLTIMPGTTISFTTTGSGITVQNGGTIKAEGLPILLNAQGENIGITSGRIILKNSVVGGKWGGILIHSPTPNELSYVDISKGGSGTYTYSSALYLRGCNVSISNSTIDDSGSNGITLYSNASLNLNTVSISNNARYGVYYESSSGPTLTHSGVTFSSNTLGNFWNGTTASDTLP